MHSTYVKASGKGVEWRAQAQDERFFDADSRYLSRFASTGFCKILETTLCVD